MPVFFFSFEDSSQLTSYHSLTTKGKTAHSYSLVPIL